MVSIQFFILVHVFKPCDITKSLAKSNLDIRNSFSELERKTSTGIHSTCLKKLGGTEYHLYPHKNWRGIEKLFSKCEKAHWEISETTFTTRFLEIDKIFASYLPLLLKDKNIFFCCLSIWILNFCILQARI